MLFSLGHSIGASSIPVGKGISKGNSVLLCLGCSEGMSSPLTGRIQRNRRFRGTRLSSESLVCYTFVEQMAAGIVTHPGKCSHSCGILTGKVAFCGAVLAEEKGWQAVRICTVCQPCHLRNKGISKPPSADAYYRIRTTTTVFHAGYPSPLPPPSLSGSR